MAATPCLLAAQAISRSCNRKCANTAVGKIASVSGRYYAMDRDRRWERELKTFEAMVKGHAEGGAYADPIARVKESYNNGITDEFIMPFVVTKRRQTQTESSATKMSASTSTIAPTAPARSPASSPATAASRSERARSSRRRRTRRNHTPQRGPQRISTTSA